MKGRVVVSVLGVCLTAPLVFVPVFVAAQQATANVVTAPTPSVDPNQIIVKTIPTQSSNEGTGPASMMPGIDLPKLDVPAGMIPTPKPTPSLPTNLPPATKAPPTKLTPVEIARQIAPRFDVARDYNRLVQCYGTADFMGAVTRVQAGRPGATPQAVNMARQIIALQDGMQPMVLAASTVRGERKFRTDYDAFAKRGQADLAKARDPNTVLRPRLATLDACRADVSRWRGGR